MSNRMKIFGLILAVTFVSVITKADSLTRLEKRSDNAAGILQELVSGQDKAIPISLLEKAVCIATVPNVLRVGFVFGVRYGKGLVSCRTPTGWSLPSFLQIKGGSWGSQFGIESIDLVMVFVSPSAAERFSRNNFTIGLDATVAAGPLGRDAQLGTDYSLESEIYSYSKARGFFAGLAIQGTAVTVDETNNTKVYGNYSAVNLLSRDGSNSSRIVSPYVDALNIFASY